MNHYTHEVLADLSEREKSAVAIEFMLQRISEEPAFAFHFGLGTRAYAQLTEALATLVGEPVEKIRRRYQYHRPGQAAPACTVAGFRNEAEGLTVKIAKIAESGPEQLAQQFHELYEGLAPLHGYETRKDSAKPWSEVPAKNKGLMIAVCAEILKRAESGPAKAGTPNGGGAS